MAIGFIYAGIQSACSKDKIYGEVVQLAKGYTSRFPGGNSPYQITARILEECGEVAAEVNHFENSGIKSQKHGKLSRQHLADEIKQAVNALIQLAQYYHVEAEFEFSIDNSLERMKNEELI